MKTKVYVLSRGKTPLSLLLASKHTHRKPLLWYDEKANEQRAIRYATNQRSIFEDEQDGQAIIGAIEFKDGTLVCDPRRDVMLIKFLEHHPDNKLNGGRVFEEMDHEKEAQDIIELINREADAVALARDLDIDELEKVAYKIWGSKTAKLMSAEIKRDVLIYARNNPHSFLDMFDDVDSDIQAAISKGLAEGYISWRKDNTELYWNLKDSKKMIHRVERGADHNKSLDKYVKSREGAEFYETLLEVMK
jgi:hypothetical protein